jgi:catechol 2,3-dioxygenase-like lactoylglutathione lyase family enzyme
VRIHQLTLATRDLAAQSAFWGETLGLSVRECPGGAVEAPLQASRIRFEQASPGADPRYHFAINVPRGSIVEAAAWIAERHELLAFHDDPDEEEGATIVHTDRGASALYFLDAGGNVVELIASDHLENDSDAPFGPESLLEIAEIGLATADTDATRAAIQDVLPAGVIWGGREGSLQRASVCTGTPSARTFASLPRQASSRHDAKSAPDRAGRASSTRPRPSRSTTARSPAIASLRRSSPATSLAQSATRALAPRRLDGHGARTSSADRPCLRRSRRRRRSARSFISTSNSASGPSSGKPQVGWSSCSSAVPSRRWRRPTRPLSVRSTSVS